MAENSKTYIPFFGCMISVKYPQFEAAVRRTMPALGITLADVDEFSCCPDPIFFKAADKLTWITIAARNIALAEQLGHDLITCCSGCTSTLGEVNHLLHEDENLRAEVNKRLEKVGIQFKASIRVRHIVTVLRDDLGFDAITRSVKRPLAGLEVAIHYGCHLLKPSSIMQVDDPDRPTIIERLVEAVGATPIHHKENLLCCGKACMNEQMPEQMVFDIVKGISDQGADCMGLICPTCFDEFDMGQIKLGRKFKESLNVPIVYYFQLLGLAQGFSPEEMGMNRHKIKVTPVIGKVGALESVGGVS